MSEKNTPKTPSDLNCDPGDKSFFLKSHGIRGIIVAAVVVGVAFVIIILSKLNEVRLQRVPFIWRSRLKSMIGDCAADVKMAQQTTDLGLSHQHAISASTILGNAKKLVGTSDLSKITGYDISKLESEVESLLRRNIPVSALTEKPKKPAIKTAENLKPLDPEEPPVPMRKIKKTRKEPQKKQYTDSKYTDSKHGRYATMNDAFDQVNDTLRGMADRMVDVR